MGDKQLQIFKSPEFGALRTVEENGKIYFVASDAAKMLGYAKPNNAISVHCKGALKRGIPTSGGVQQMNIIPEGDLYRLIVHSELPSAEKFESWVFDEVLPSIRKTGSYSMPKVTPNPHYRTRMVGTAIRDIGKTAESLEQVFGVRHEMALTSATSLIGEAYGIDMTPIKPLIPAVAEPTTIGTLTPKKIAEELGVKFKTGSPDGGKVNAKLAELGLQEKRGKEWHLTEKGKQYGEAKPFTQNGHSGYQIGWGKSVIELLRSKLN